MHLSGNNEMTKGNSVPISAVRRQAERASVVNNLPVLLEADAIQRQQLKLRKDHDKALRAPIKHLAIDYFLGTSAERKHIRQINAALQSAGENGFAGLKLGRSPIAILLDRRKIGGEELTAAQDIEAAFMAISGSLMIKPLSMERVSAGKRAGDYPDTTTKAIARYQAWANHWSNRAKRGDKTLEITIAAIIDMRAFSVIEADVGLRHGMAQKITVRALRDYAARAGWSEGAVTKRWKAEAEESFKLVPIELAFAMSRARALVGEEG